MAGWHHRCNGHELGQTSEDGEGQGGLVCHSPWGRKESDMTGRLNDSKRMVQFVTFSFFKYLFIYLASSSLSCDTWELGCIIYTLSLWCMDSLGGGIGHGGM